MIETALEKISIASPDTPPAEELQEKFLEILSRNELTNGREVARFEAEAAEALEAPECVAVSSCTAGLMLVNRCLGLRGEAITPSFTFFATGHALLWNNVRPVFGDCDPDAFQLDPESAERLIGPETSAIVGVHLFGCPAPVDDLEALAERKGLPLIFEAAHALGARWRGASIASRGDASVYSLSPTKLITTGEGGLIVTERPELARELRQARNYGKGEHYDCDVLGLNARMSELQAALGRAGVSRLGDVLRRRNQVAELYESRLRNLPGIGLQRVPAHAYSSRKDFAITVGPRNGRDALSAELDAHGVETRNYFDPPLHRQTLYRRWYQPEIEPLDVTDQISSSVLCLPMHSRLEDGQVRRVCDVIERFAESGMRRAG